jgi:hypothetical protein
MSFEYSFRLLVKSSNQITFDKFFSNLKGNYIFGRNYKKCLSFSQCLSQPTAIVEIPNPPNYLSSIHAVICEIEGHYHLIDGWGKNYSRNGVFVNEERVYFKVLQDSDIIHFGSKNIEIIFYKLNEEVEKITEDSQFF